MSEMKLKPCPKCKSQNVGVHTRVYAGNSIHAKDNYRVECTDCEHGENWEFYEKDAIMNWNTRLAEDALGKRVGELEGALRIMIETHAPTLGRTVENLHIQAEAWKFAVSALTPAQEKAGDEEEWCVVRRVVLKEILLDHIHCHNRLRSFDNPGIPRTNTRVKDMPEYMNWLTAAEEGKGGG